MKQKSHPMANQFLGLALFIMLLSFFIVLNALSSFKETKIQSVLQSIDMAFTAGALEREPNISIRPSVQDSIKKGDVLDNIKGLFESQIAGLNIKRNRLGTKMYIEIPARDFERLLELDDGDFLRMLTNLVQTKDTGVAYRMDIVFSMPEKPSTIKHEAPEALDDLSGRVSEMAKKLENAGLERRFLSIGLAQGQENTVILHFKRYEPVDLSSVLKEDSAL